MKSKVESLQGYNSIEANHNVIKLLLERLKRADIQNARCAIWILDNMPDSEECPHNETAGQRASHKLNTTKDSHHVLMWQNPNGGS
jgi:hypothetical protein